MTVYFCLDDLLETLLQNPAENADLDLFIPVSTTPASCKDHREDALILSSTPKLLDLNDQKGAYQLASLIDEVPLYQINLELLVDAILTARHDNQMVAQAVATAFGGTPIPNTLEQTPEDNTTDILPNDLIGSLRHPMLGHLDKATLTKIYIGFMQALPHGHDDFSFERHVLGRHAGPFKERYDGYVFATGGKVRAAILLGFSTRSDYDPRKPLESYVDSGLKKAAAMQITEMHEMIWAWLEADHYQMRRCHDLDRVLTLKGLPRMPNWIKTDVFNCLEKEAIKQVLAERIVAHDRNLSLLQNTPHIKKAIEANGTGNVDEFLQQLLAQTLSNDTQYSRAADRFYTRALDRARESKTL